MHRIMNFRHLLFLCVLGSLLAGCANDEAPTATDDPKASTKSVVVPPMAGYWPLAVGNVWEFSYSHTWYDASVFTVGAAMSGTHTGSVRWQLLDTTTTADGFVITIRERFIGQAVETRLASDQPVTWQSVSYPIADSATTFTLTIHRDSSLSIVNHPDPSWGRGEFPGIFLNGLRVPSGNPSAQTIEQDGLQSQMVLTRGVGPSNLRTSYYGNTHRREISVVLQAYTIVGG